MKHLIALLFILISSKIALADRVLSQKEILARCYAQLTGQRLPVGDPLWAKLATGSATSVCLSVFDQVQLGSNGVLTQQTNPVARRILKQFHDFHRSWLPNQTHWAFPTSFPDSYYGNVDVYDPSEPSLYITRSLFSQQPVPYSSITQGYQSLSAVRDASTPGPNARGGTGTLRVSRFYLGDGADPVYEMNAVSGQTAAGAEIYIRAPVLQVGQLIGIQPVSGDTATANLWVKNYTQFATLAPADVVKPQNFHQHYGGGILGNVPYLSLNLGQDFGYSADGAIMMPRRAIMNAFNTFMCLSGPFSRATDVGAYLVDASTDPNGAPFRHSTSCLRCHATMDQSAMTLRGLRLGSTVNNVGGGRDPSMIVSTPPDLGTANPYWPSVSTPNFYRTTPQGRLFFRSINGSLIDQPVANLDALGAALATTDDLYACAAKRYFQYFTGINVNLFDPYDPANSSMVTAQTSKDLEYRTYVLSLGQSLKQSGSLNGLVHQIINSDYYKLAGFGR